MFEPQYCNAVTFMNYRKKYLPFFGPNNVEIFSHVLWQRVQVAIMTYLRKSHEQFPTVLDVSKTDTSILEHIRRLGRHRDVLRFLATPFKSPDSKDKTQPLAPPE